MKIHSVTGDIIQFSPQHAELSALWVRSGFNGRFTTWSQIREKYRDVIQPVRGGSNPECPWLAPTDSILELLPPDGRLKWFYLFSNPTNLQGKPTLESVRDAVKKCLDAAVRIQVKTVSLIHIPWALPGEMSSKRQKIESARAMIEAARQWDTAHPGQITDLYLVDLDGDFGPLLPPEY